MKGRNRHHIAVVAGSSSADRTLQEGLAMSMDLGCSPCWNQAVVGREVARSQMGAATRSEGLAGVPKMIVAALRSYSHKTMLCSCYHIARSSPEGGDECQDLVAGRQETRS